MAVILDFCPEQNARDKRIVRETARKLGQVIIFPGVRIERHGDTASLSGSVPGDEQGSKENKV